MKSITIARLANVAPSFVCEILNGKKRPSPSVAARLEAATNINRIIWLYPEEYPGENPLLKYQPGKPSNEAQPSQT